MAFSASGESVPGFEVASGGQSSPPMRTMESPRTRASGRTARRTSRRAIRRAGASGVVAGGQHGPAVVAADEVDRQRVGQLLVDVADLYGHARAARVDALELGADDLGLAALGGRRHAQTLERVAQLGGGVGDLVGLEPTSLEGEVAAHEPRRRRDRLRARVRLSTDLATLAALGRCRGAAGTASVVAAAAAKQRGRG